MYTTLLVLHFVGLALGVGTSFAFLTLGLAVRSLPPAERAAFMLRAFALSKNGSIGLLLLLVSGVAMLAVRGVGPTFALAGPLFHLKLTLVAVMLGPFGYLQVLMKRAKQQGGGPLMARIPKVGQVMLLLGLAVIVTATLAFH